MPNNIILNRIQTPDGTILTSYHVHDYQSHIDKNGHFYAVDGGLQYLKRSVPIFKPLSTWENIKKNFGFRVREDNISAKDLSLHDNQSFEVIRKSLHWGVNMDKDKKLLPETKWTPICDLNTDHLRTLIKGGWGSDWIREYFKQELEYRQEQHLIEMMQGDEELGNYDRLI